MRHDDLVYVGQMADVAQKIEDRRLRLDRNRFDADEDVRLALAHLVQTLGEAAHRVSATYCAAHPEIPWSAIIGMRHRIVHDYLSVDFDLVWEVTSLEIPDLLSRLRELLPESG